MTKKNASKADTEGALLNAVYSLVFTLLNENPSVEVTLNLIARQLISTMHHPDHCGTLIEWQDKQYTAGNWDSSHRHISSKLSVGETKTGRMLVCYDGSISADSDNPFTANERQIVEFTAKITSLFLDHRKFEHERNQNVELFKQLLDHGPAIGFIWDPSENWPVLYVSRNIETLGYDAEDFIQGKVKYDSLIHPDDLDRVEAEVSHNLEQGLKKYEQRYRIVTKDGDVRLARDWTMVNRAPDGEVVSIEGIILDITDYVAADEQARNYLDVTNDIFLSLDDKGRILNANDRTSQIIGVARDELIGRDWIANYVHVPDRPEVEAEFARIINGETSGIQEFENQIIAESGQRYYIHWYFSVELNSRGAVSSVMAFGADVTAKKRAESQAGRLGEVLMANPNPVLRLSKDSDVQIANTKAQELLARIGEQGNASEQSWNSLVSAAITSKTDFTQELHLAESTYLFMVSPDHEQKHINLYGLDVTEQQSMATLIRGVSESMPGAMFKYSLMPDGSDSINYMNPGCEDIWEVPAKELQGNPAHLWQLILPEDFPAVQESVNNSAKTLEKWTQTWRIKPRSGRIKWLRGSGAPRRLANGGTSWTTIILDVTEAKEAEIAVSEALHKTVFVLSAALEARDPYTAGHEQRVTKIAVLIGKELGLDKHQLTGLELAATVHDVGKIRVPLEILSKPTRLTDTEFELIKIHPVAGAELLKDIDFEWPISEIIRQHHERIDGSGYPDGLTGDKILFEAKIIAVADTLEAMASHRPYRAGLGIEKAAEEIRSGAGKRYDAKCAQACLKLVEEGKIDLSANTEAM